MNISSSEVATLDSCRKKHFYAHELKLAPVNDNDAILRGNIIHEGLAEYYKFIQANGWMKRQEAVQVALEHVQAQLLGHLTQASTIAQAYDLLTKYFDYYNGENFRVLGVEEYHEIPLDTDITFAMRLDLLLEMTSGPWRGEVIVVDHKSTFNFWSSIQKDLNPQLMKYIYTLNKRGYNVKRAMVNQIRTRQLKSTEPSDYFKRIFIKYKTVELETVMADHHVAAREIMDRRRLPIVERGVKARRTMGQNSCNMCSFTDLCKFDLMGVPIENTIAANFKKNPYGY